MRLASAHYARAAVAISIWAVLTPLKAGRGLAGHVALFAPLVAYALALASSARRVRPRETGSSAPAAIVYGLLLLHSAIGLAGSTILAVVAAQGNPRGVGMPEWAGTLAGLTWPCPCRAPRVVQANRSCDSVRGRPPGRAIGG